MRKILLLLAAATLMSSCSYQQFDGVARGSSLGGMFGSCIGGLTGGYQGSMRGTAAGMIIGGAVGAMVTAPRQPKQSKQTTNNYEQRSTQDDVYADNVDRYNRRPYRSNGTSSSQVQFDSYNDDVYQSPAASISDLDQIEVCNLQFLDANDNEALDINEQGLIVMDIYNRGNKTLYNVTPIIQTDNKRIAIAPAATIATLEPGAGIRYKAAVKLLRRTNSASARFTIDFSNGTTRHTATSFIIPLR